MAEIAPLRGIFYNTDKISDLSEVVSPPYDVVTPEEQASYHNAHPNNVMHLILGAKHPDDAQSNSWHQRAGQAFRQWREDEILIQADEPAIYYTELDFLDPISGLQKTRSGYMCLLKLEDFDHNGSVRPHERTFSATKAERLDLLLNAKANLSQIFAVYNDEEAVSTHILQSALPDAPMFDFIDDEDHGHRIWPVTDPVAISKLAGFMSDKIIYIADGHHRYETSLNYQRSLRENGVQFGPHAAPNYTLVYLCAVNDPGLIILPAHRLVKNSLTLSKDELLSTLDKFFEVETIPFTSAENRAARKAFMRKLAHEGESGSTIGLFTRLAESFFLLKLREGNFEGTELAKWPLELRKLDTVVLTGLILQEVLGISDEGLDDPERITYTSRASRAINRVSSGQVEVACILNPTRIEQVQDVAEAKLIMPQKATYFFPKVTSGLLFNSLDPAEEIQSAI